MRNRTKARCVALEALYQLDVRGDECLDELEEFLASSRKAPFIVDFARDLVLGTWAGRERYDAMIAPRLTRWDVSRLSPLDRSILRLGTHELCAALDPPGEVAIHEAVKLANKYSSAEAGRLVNAVLEAVWRELRAGEPAVDATTAEPAQPATP